MKKKTYTRQNIKVLAKFRGHLPHYKCKLDVASFYWRHCQDSWHYSDILTMNESSNSMNESDELFQAANDIQNNPENEKRRSEISPEGKAYKARTLLYFE